MKCPICKDIMIFPRLYPQCGHTLCEPCMIKHDTAEKDKTRSTFNSHIYSCPICRQTTLLGWFHRPINRLILQELRQSKEYEQAYTQYKKNRGNIPKANIPEDVDLSQITKTVRREKTEILYKEILILLFDAATKGKPFITISDKTTVHDIQLVADLLSTKLFDKNKIYKLVTTPNECDIEIIQSNRSYKSEYVNPLIHSLPQGLRHTRSLGILPIRTRQNILSTSRSNFSDNPHV